MKRILYICCLIGLAACNNNKPKTTEAYTATPTGLEGIQKSGASTTAPATTQTSNTYAAALNPAHGAPGHRCDIAVGAPLNSAANQTAASVPVQQQIVPQAPATAPANASAAGQKLNPAHGAPGHRCDIAVGAPLDSKPTTAPAVVAQPQASVAQPTTKAPSTAATPMFNEKGQRLNPAHGAPGHKCEIAVGAPLT